MLAVAIDLLAGRYTATVFNDRFTAEWPPHPVRLFAAMVAAWADRDERDPLEAQALRWLEAQPAPDITCDGPSGIRRRSPVTHFVPVNDTGAFTDRGTKRWDALAAAETALAEARAGGDARAITRATTALAKAEQGIARVTPASPVAAGALAVLPDERGRQGRAFPTVVPDTPTVWFTWPDADPSDECRSALDSLLARVGRLGHPSTLVACRIDDDPPPASLTVRHGRRREGDPLVRIPQAGLLDFLEADHQRHLGREPRTVEGVAVAYAWRHRVPTPPEPPLLGGEWYVLGLPPGQTLGLQRALDLTRAVRGALLAHGPQPAPPVLSGHEPGPAPSRPIDGPHLAVVPLAAVLHPRNDGAIRGVALILPRDADADDRAALVAALAAWRTADGLPLTLPGHRGAPWLLRDLGFERGDGEPHRASSPMASLRRRTWTRPARRWATVTPIALDRVPGQLRAADPVRRQRAFEEAEATIARSCELAGLPAPASVEVRLDPVLSTVPHLGPDRRGRGRRPFPPFRTGGTNQPRVCVNAVLTFDPPVAGPVLVGAGRFLGYGLCLPLGDE